MSDRDGQQVYTVPHPVVAEEVIKAEQSVLGAMMIDPAYAAPLVRAIITVEDFYRPPHKSIWRAICILIETGGATDPLSVTEQLKKQNAPIDGWEPLEYVMNCVEAHPWVNACEHHARIVKEDSDRRRLLRLSVEFGDKLGKTNGDASTAADLQRWIRDELAGIDASDRRLDVSSLMSLSDILTKALKPIEWVVDGLIPRRGITIIGGDSGVGKSWLVYALALSVVAGVPWLGRYYVDRGRVLIGDVENGEELIMNRVRKLFTGLCIDYSIDTDLPLDVFPHALKFDSPADRDGLIRFIKERNITLVIGDPLIHSLPRGTDENDAASMAAFFETVRELQKEIGYGCAFIFTHHARKTNKLSSNDAGQMLRGSSAVRAVLDSHLFVRALPGDESDPAQSTKLLMIEHDKSRCSPELAPFTVRIEQIDNQATTIHYVAEANQLTATRAAVTSEFIVRTLADAGGSMFRKDIIQAAEGSGVSERTAERILKAAVKAGELTVARVGNGMVYSLKMDGLLCD